MNAPRTPRVKTEDPRLDLYILSQQRVEADWVRLHDLSEERHNQLLKILGDEDTDEKGEPVGKGLRGRVMRLEIWRRTMSGWVKYGAGVVASATLFLAAIRYLAPEKLLALLKN